MAWTITPSLVSKAKHWIKIKFLCTSDGNALSATDLLPLLSAYDPTLHNVVLGSTITTMKVFPGTGGVLPNTTIDITLSDEESDSVWADTGIDQTQVTWHDISKDSYALVPILGNLYLTMNDIGDSGDQVTIYFYCWVEDKGEVGKLLFN